MDAITRSGKACTNKREFLATAAALPAAAMLAGYNAPISLADARSYRMLVATHVGGKPLALGGLRPQWAVYEADFIATFKDKPVKERSSLCPWGLYFVNAGAG